MRILLSLLTLSIAFNAHAYGIGLSSYPLEADTKYISAEFTGITSAGGGVGLQGRYTQKLNEKSAYDFGLGMAGGEHSGRLFAGYDYELYPDYQTQPRVSLKGYFENSKEFNSRRNIVGVAPSISKGFTFWDREAFPYFSLPYGLSLDSSNQTYNSVLSANIGVTGVFKIHMDGQDKTLTANAEAIIGLKDSFSGLFFGFAYPIQ